MKKMKFLLIAIAAVLMSNIVSAQWATNGNDIYNSNSANVGIGTGTSISSKFHVTGGAVLFDGTTGSTPVSGSGTRLMWIPAKAAFRAGSVSGSQWNDANIGSNSYAFGSNTTASGSNSFAVGSNTTASGSGSVSMGGFNYAGGQNAFSLGFYADATQNNSVSIGSYVESTASGAFTIGMGTNPYNGNLTNNVTNSLMIGFNSTIPTFFVGPSSGAGTTGSVAVATTTIPSTTLTGGYKFVVSGHSNFDGSVVIGTTSSFTASTPFPSGYKLYVADGILTERVKVAVKSTTDWSDFVFGPGYRLRPLEEVESYIVQNKHLPDVPSAEEVVNNGVDLQKMDATLLQKVEELTLYVIQLKKQNDELQQKVEALEKEVK